MQSHYHRQAILLIAFFIILFFFSAISVMAGNEPRGGPVPCGCEAYVVDTDPKGLNVRSGPGTDYPIIATLPTNHPVEVSITGSYGPWMVIERAYIFADEGMTEDVEKELHGVVYGPLLAVMTRSNGRALVPLYAGPYSGSGVVAELPTEIEVTLSECRDGWMKVKHGDIEGWLDPSSHCGNPVTTCP